MTQPERIQELESALARIALAVTNPVVNPEYHRAQQRRLQEQWPVLNSAIRNGVAVLQKGIK